MERLLFESAVRALFIAASTALVLRGMGINTAAERHRAWTVVVLLMLVLPFWTALGPDVPLRILPAPAISAQPAAQPLDAAIPSPLPVWAAGEIAAEPGPAVSHLSASSMPADSVRIDWRHALIGVYLAGVFLMLLRLAIGMVQARKLIRSAVLQDGRLTSGSCSSPITVGFLDPVVILPIEWQHWPPDQLKAILTHESEHANKYHPFAQWFALLNRAVFWFHPLAWWLERRMAALAEESCDAAVLAAGHSPQDYSEYLLNLARSMMRSGQRIGAVGMAMAGSSLNTRIRQILAGIPSQRISTPRIAFAMFCLTISAGVFGATTLSSRDVAVSNSSPDTPAVMDSAAQDLTQVDGEEQVAEQAVTNPLVIEVTDTSVPAPLDPVAVSVTEVLVNGPAAAPTPPLPTQASRDNTPAVPAPAIDRISAPIDVSLGLALVRTSAAVDALLPSAWWSDPLLVVQLGLDDAQKARIAEVFEQHRQEIVQSRERSRIEDSQLSQLLAVDRIDSEAVLAQIERVVQARAQMQRASAAVNLEIRRYLRPAQWLQLRAQVPITSLDSRVRFTVLPAVQRP
jgi:hypothetical protein